MQVGQVLRVSSKAELQAAEKAALPQQGTSPDTERYVIMDASDWKVNAGADSRQHMTFGDT